MTSNVNALHPVQVTLYAKPDCGLCDTLQDDLRWLQRELSFTVVTRDINDDPALREKFQYLVPVLEIGDTFYTPPHDLLQTRLHIIAAARAEGELNSHE